MSQLTAATVLTRQMLLQMMITHHQRAIEMADTEIVNGSNPDALALAEAIKTSQTRETPPCSNYCETCDQTGALAAGGQRSHG